MCKTEGNVFSDTGHHRLGNNPWGGGGGLVPYISPIYRDLPPDRVSFSGSSFGQGQDSSKDEQK